MVLIFQEVFFPKVSGSHHMMQILGSSGKDVYIIIRKESVHYTTRSSSGVAYSFAKGMWQSIYVSKRTVQYDNDYVSSFGTVSKHSTYTLPLLLHTLYMCGENARNYRSCALQMPRLLLPLGMVLELCRLA